MKKTVEEINRVEGVFWNAVECPLCGSTETCRMNGKPIGKLAADEMAAGKVFCFCGKCGAGFFAAPPVGISDEALMIGNMLTLMLEDEWRAKEHRRAADVWKRGTTTGRALGRKLESEAMGAASASEMSAFRIEETLAIFLDIDPEYDVLLRIRLGLSD